MSRDSVLTRAFSVLTALSEEQHELELDELAERSGLPRSTVHRLLLQLTRIGAVERTTRGWQLGTRLFELGHLVPRQERLRSAALGPMQQLFDTTHETIHLAILDDDEALYVEIVSGRPRVLVPSRRGGRMPLHCTGVGKVLLAFSPDGGRAWAQRKQTLPRRTPRTQTHPGRLLEELHQVRRVGLAYDDEEAVAHLGCVAVPVLRSDGTAEAALSVSAPASDDATRQRTALALRNAALELTRELRAASP